MNLINQFANNSLDSDELRLKKKSAIIISGACTIAGVGWTVMYLIIYGFGLTAILPAFFVVTVGLAIIVSHFTKNYLYAIYAQIFCIIYVTTFIQWSIGAIADSGFVMAWALLGPITALTFFTLKEASIWFFLFMVNLVITVTFDDHFGTNHLEVSNGVYRLYFLMNLGASSVVVFIFASFFVSNTLKEKKRADLLLLNILPTSIAKTLKEKSGVIAKKHSDVSVLFADIVGFTAYAGKADPEELVYQLDEIFNRFDQIASKYQLEKIKTIGDAYMVASGIPEDNAQHQENIGEMAKEMLNAIKEINKSSGTNFDIRIGIHSGPVVAGVIGKSKFAYDLWGDTVNIASRMESSGEAGKIQVSDVFYKGAKSKFNYTSRGQISVKGKGEMETYFLS